MRRQRERQELPALRPTRGDDDELSPLTRPVDYRIRLPSAADRRFPQLLASGDIQRMEAGAAAGDEHQPAAGDDDPALAGEVEQIRERIGRLGG
jgi:hypothetical protein